MFKAVQLGLFENIKVKKKRVRYKVPTYTKFYSIWQYDRNKFKTLIKDRKHGLNNLTQNEILEQCFIRDENGNKLKDSDEKHIFRISVLQKIYEQVFFKAGFEYIGNNKMFIEDGLAVHPEDLQAEIIDTWQLSIKKRILIHIKLLRLLKQGMSVKKAVNKIKREL